MAAVVLVTEVAERTYRLGLWGEREGRRKLYAYVDDQTISMTDLLASSLLPALLDQHPDDSTIILTDKQATQDPDIPTRFNVDLTYQSRRANSNGQEQDDSEQPPENRPTRITFPGSKKISRTVWQDADGKAYKTAAGEVIEGMKRPFALPIVRFEKWFTVLNSNLVLNYHNVTNSDTFWIGGPEQWYVEELSFTPEMIDGRWYYQMTLDLVLDRDKHIQKVLNAGFKELKDLVDKDDNPYTKLTAIKDEVTGRDVTKPWPLNEIGQALTVEQLQDTSTDYINYLEFREYEKKPFAAFQLF